MSKSNTTNVSSNMDIELPLKNITKEDVYGALLVHKDNPKELYQDALMELQTWIKLYTEEVIKPLRESNRFTEDYLDHLEKTTCVISPWTLTLYLHWLQMEQFVKMTDSEKEKILLEKIPDRFRVRYRGNITNRNAREIQPNEETIESEQSVLEKANAKRRMSFSEYLEEFGKEVKQSINKIQGEKG